LKTDHILLDVLDSLHQLEKTVALLTAPKTINNYDKTTDIQVCPDGVNPDAFMDYIEAINKAHACESAGRNGEMAEPFRKEEPPMPKQIEGSKPYKRKDGRWQCIYYDNRSPKTVYAGTKLDCIDKVNAAVRCRDKNATEAVVSKRVVLASWIPQWLEVYKKGKLKESSYENILTTLVAYMKKSPLYKKEIVRITTIDLQKFLNGITSPSARARTFIYLRECMDALVKNRTIKENVCNYIDAPKKPEAKEKIVPTAGEMDIFFSRLKEASPSYYLLAKFIASTGLRKGEAFALLWSDISIEEKTVSVTKAYDQISKTITTPKSRKATRTVPLFDGALEVLGKIKRSAKPVFSFIGKTASNKNFPAACERAGFPNITFHVLRHVFTTRCLENGVDPKIIQKWLGHAKLDMTMNTYAHTNGDFEHEQSLKMAENSH